MSHELLPCPFCGGDANAKPHSQHLPGCYFDAMASLKAAPKGDLSMAPEVVRAWNRRATQPAVPEQYEYWCVAYGCWRPIQKLVEFLTARGFKVRAVRGAEHEQ